MPKSSTRLHIDIDLASVCAMSSAEEGRLPGSRMFQCCETPCSVLAVFLEKLYRIPLFDKASSRFHWHAHDRQLLRIVGETPLSFYGILRPVT